VTEPVLYPTRTRAPFGGAHKKGAYYWPLFGKPDLKFVYYGVFHQPGIADRYQAAHKLHLKKKKRKKKARLYNT
jgi:hypothetical protein